MRSKKIIAVLAAAAMITASSAITASAVEPSAGGFMEMIPYSTDNTTTWGKAALSSLNDDGTINGPYRIMGVYLIDGTFKKITGIESDEKQVRLPTDYDILAIGSSSSTEPNSRSVIKPDSSIEKLIVSKNISLIEENAFADADSLKEIVLPEYVTYIGSNAFPTRDDFTLTVKQGSVADDYAKANGINTKYYDSYDNIVPTDSNTYLTSSDITDQLPAGVPGSTVVLPDNGTATDTDAASSDEDKKATGDNASSEDNKNSSTDTGVKSPKTGTPVTAASAAVSLAVLGAAAAFVFGKKIKE